MAAISYYNPLAVNVGAVGTPSYAFLGETNTGVYRPGAGIIGFSILGTELARVTANGLIIGTATDDGASKLQVTGASVLTGMLTVILPANVQGIDTSSGSGYRFTVGRADQAALGFGTTYIGFNAARTASNTWTLNADGANSGGTAVWSKIGNGTLVIAPIVSAGNVVQTLTDATVNSAIRYALGSANFAISTGLISLTNGTSNLFDFGQNGVGAPTFTTLSAGAKLALYNNISGSAAGYCIGIESSSMWFGVSQTSSVFKWYGGITERMRSAATTGALLINQTTDDTVTKLQVTGGINVDGVKTFEVQRTVDESTIGNTVDIGTFSQSSQGVWVKIRMQGTVTNTVQAREYWVFSTAWVTQTGWMEVPLKAGMGYGTGDIALDVRQQTAGSGSVVIETRIRVVVANSPNSLLLNVFIETNSAVFTASTTTGTGATVVGYLAQNGYQFPAATARWNSSSTGLFISGAGRVSIGTTTDDGTNSLQVTGTSLLSASLTVTPAVLTSGSNVAFRVVAAAHTTQTAATEVTDVDFNVARTLQFATSTPSIQRSVLVRAPTYSCDTAAQTITTAASFAITGPPVAGANVTLTNSWSLWVQTGSALFGSTSAGITTNNGNLNCFGGSQPLTLTQSAVSAATRYTVAINPGNQVISPSGVENPQFFYSAHSIQWATTTPTTQREWLINAPTYSCDTAAQTITTAATFNIVGPPVAGTNVTITTPLALRVEAGNVSLSANTDNVLTTGYGIMGLPTGGNTTRFYIAQASNFNLTDYMAEQLPTGQVAFNCKTGTTIDIRQNNVVMLGFGSAGTTATFSAGVQVVVSDTTTAGSGSGALNVSGGISAVGLNVGLDSTSGPLLTINGAVASNRLLRFRTASVNRWNIYADSAPEPGSDAGSALIISAYTDLGAYIDDPLKFTRAAGGLVTFGRPVSMSSTLLVTGTVTINGGTVTLSNATSNKIDFGSNGVAAPTFTSYSAGVKVLLFNQLDASHAGYAIGIETSHIWFGVATTGAGFKWYQGTTETMRLSANNSNLMIGTTTDNGVDKLQVNGSLSLVTALAAIYGGTGFGAYVLGDTLYASSTTALSKLSGNTTVTRKFLRQVGNGTISAAPAWDTLTVSDIPALPTPTGSSIRALMLMGG